jgi:carbon monoxide dehydrogenase subunit G
VRIEHEIHIDREPAEVFAFLTDSENLSAWQPTTVAVRRQQQGPLALGERFEEVHKALRRELASTVEVAAYDPPRLFALHLVSGAVPLDGRWELEPSPGGTLLRFVGEGDVHGLLRLTKPMLARQFRGYHKRLKDLVEDLP